MSDTAELTIKQGATFQLLISLTNDDGTPVDLATCTVTSDLRTARLELVASLTLTPTSTPGQLSVAEPTDTWPIGKLVGDFKITSNSTSTILKSAGFTVAVQSSVTA